MANDDQDIPPEDVPPSSEAAPIKSDTRDSKDLPANVPISADATTNPAGPPPISPIASAPSERRAERSEPAPAKTGGGPSQPLPGETPKSRKDEIKKGVRPGDPAALIDNLGIPNPPEVPLMELKLEYWAELDLEKRKACYNAIDTYFHNLLEDFRANANSAVKSYTSFGKSYTRWRFILIVATGLLAILNVLAASTWNADSTLAGMKAQSALSLLAAVYAAFLALLTNLESFFNYTEKKTSTRESRELYLDAYRHFEMLRLTQVYPYGYSAQACYNFNEIYRRLVSKDLELRRKIMQLSETRPGHK